MGTKRIILAVVLAVFMVFTMMPTGLYSAFAEEEKAATSIVENAEEETAVTNDTVDNHADGNMNSESKATSSAGSSDEKSGGG